jgi:hypothetical protein
MGIEAYRNALGPAHRRSGRVVLTVLAQVPAAQLQDTRPVVLLVNMFKELWAQYKGGLLE